MSPPSACPVCSTEITHRDNIPVVSWLLLRGKCRTCATPISARYPLIELLCAVLFVLTALVLGDTAELPAVLVFVAAGIALSAIDIEHLRLPDRVVFPTLALVGFALTVAAALDNTWTKLWWAIGGAVFAAGTLFTIRLAYRRGMGLGDVKLALVLGMVTGWYGPARIALGLFLGFFVGSALGIGLGVRAGGIRGVKMPFGPSLIAGAFVAVLFGDRVLNWYRDVSGL